MILDAMTPRSHCDSNKVCALGMQLPFKDNSIGNRNRLKYLLEII